MSHPELRILLLLPAVVHCSAATADYTVHVRIAADAAARVSIVDSGGDAVTPDKATARKAKDGTSWFYADGSFDVTLPAGRTLMRVAGGLEVVPQTVTFDPSDKRSLTVTLTSWIHPADDGWYSGDSHVHLETGGPVAATLPELLLAARAEGLNYVNVAVSNSLGDDVRGAQRITGKAHSSSTAEHLIVFGEEMRSSIYGHMQFFGINKLVEPQYTGFADTPNFVDYPANYVMAKEATEQGGVVSYSHPMFSGQPNPFEGDLTADSGAARELPVDAALRVVHAVDLMCYNSDEDLSAELWYRLLNCGLRLSACAGTDALLDNHTSPMGGDRVYVQTDGRLTMQNWLDGLRQGRTFVTNGPMPTLTVNGQSPGATLNVPSGTTLTVHASVTSWFPVEKLDIIVNGEVVETRTITQKPDAAGVTRQQFEVSLTLKDTSWVALKIRGGDHPQLFDGPAWAHTSPVYVVVDGERQRSENDGEFFVDWIDQLLRVVAARNRYAGIEERTQVEELFRRAREKFAK